MADGSMAVDALSSRETGGNECRAPAFSMRSELLRWLLIPLTVLVAVNTYTSYDSAVEAANTAYDRSLLASARTIADRIRIEEGKTAVDIPYVVLGLSEASVEGRVYYRVSGLGGEFVSGYDDLPPLREQVARSETYPALIRFYDDVYHGMPIRMAALQQPLYDGANYGAALIQVAESTHTRLALARQILFGALFRQLLLVISTVLVILLALRLAFRPLNRLGADIEKRVPTDLSPLSERLTPIEIRPFIVGINRYIGQLRFLLDNQKRFIEEASHQLRTSLTLLQTQTGVGMRQKDLPGALEIIAAVNDSATHIIRLANQLLSRARARHTAAMQTQSPVDLARIARDACLQSSQTALNKFIDLGFENDNAVSVEGDSLFLHELIANLLDNALRYTPRHGRVTVRVYTSSKRAILEIEDNGPGIPIGERERVFEPFYRLAAEAESGAGLGLSIVRDIARAHGASVELSSATESRGLLVTVAFEHAAAIERQAPAATVNRAGITD